MPTDLLIRKALPEDFEIVYSYICMLEDTAFEKNCMELVYNQNCLNPFILYKLAFINNQPVGFISCHIQSLLHHNGLIGEIQELVIDPEYRNAGIGKKLIDEVIDSAKKQKVLQIEVTSNLLRNRAHNFYVKSGFIDSHKKFTYPLV